MAAAAADGDWLRKDPEPSEGVRALPPVQRHLTRSKAAEAAATAVIASRDTAPAAAGLLRLSSSGKGPFASSFVERQLISFNLDTLSDGLCYFFRNHDTEWALDAKAGRTGTGLDGDILTRPFVGNTYQTWIATKMDDGNYIFKNSETGKVLDSNTIGLVYDHDYNGGDFQKWTATPKANGYYRLVNVATGKPLESNEYGYVSTGFLQGRTWQDWAVSVTPCPLKDRIEAGVCYDTTKGNMSAKEWCGADASRNCCNGNWYTCADFSGVICRGSCNGEAACYQMTGNVGVESCLGAGSCERSSFDVGDYSCATSDGMYACFDKKGGSVGNNSCRNQSSCAHSCVTVGNDSCNNDSSCRHASGIIANNVCNDNAYECAVSSEDTVCYQFKLLEPDSKPKCDASQAIETLYQCEEAATSGSIGDYVLHGDGRVVVAGTWSHTPCGCFMDATKKIWYDYGTTCTQVHDEYSGYSLVCRDFGGNLE